MARKRKRLITRLFLFLVGLLFLVLFTVLLAGVIWVGPAVKKAVEVYGPEALRAPVKVGDVSAGFLRGAVKVQNLVIGNPEGYREPVAIDARALRIRLRLRSLFSDTVVIEEILLDDPVITYEKRNGVTNLTQLQRNAMIWADSLSSKEADEPSRKVVIERFRIRNGTLRVKLPHLPAVPIQLPDIERRNIGGKGSDGQNFGHAAKDLLGSLQLNASDAVADAGDAIEKTAKDALKAGKDFGGKALKSGGKALDGAGDALKGLLGK